MAQEQGLLCGVAFTPHEIETLCRLVAYDVKKREKRYAKPSQAEYRALLAKEGRGDSSARIIEERRRLLRKLRLMEGSVV